MATGYQKGKDNQACERFLWCQLGILTSKNSYISFGD